MTVDQCLQDNGYGGSVGAESQEGRLARLCKWERVNLLYGANGSQLSLIGNYPNSELSTGRGEGKYMFVHPSGFSSFLTEMAAPFASNIRLSSPVSMPCSSFRSILSCRLSPLSIFRITFNSLHLWVVLSCTPHPVYPHSSGDRNYSNRHRSVRENLCG